MADPKNYTLDISLADEDAVTEALEQARLKLQAMPVEERRQLELPALGIACEGVGTDGLRLVFTNLEAFLLKLGVSLPPKAQA